MIHTQTQTKNKHKKKHTERDIETQREVHDFGEGLMMHQKFTCIGMVVSRVAVLQPRITAVAKNRRGIGKDGERRSEESLACARKVVVSRRWAALVLHVAAAVVASSTTTTLFLVLPSPPPLLLPPVLAEETDSRYTQLCAMIMDAKFLSGRKKENSLPQNFLHNTYCIAIYL